jgi:hypothetical protein
MFSPQELREIERARALPAWGRILVAGRNLTPHEICLLQEIFEDAVVKNLRGSEQEELGITLGVLKAPDYEDED